MFSRLSNLKPIHICSRSCIFQRGLTVRSVYRPSQALKRKTLGDTHPLGVFFFSFYFLHLLSLVYFKILSCCFQDRPLNLCSFTASHNVSRLCNVVNVNQTELSVFISLFIASRAAATLPIFLSQIVFIQKLTNLVILCLRKFKCMYYYGHYWRL